MKKCQSQFLLSVFAIVIEIQWNLDLTDLHITKS